MARPPLRIGTLGNIKTTSLGRGRAEARARFRMGDGSIKHLRRTGKTMTEASDNLKEAARDLRKEITSGHISADTRMARIAELWHADLARDAQLGEGSKGTVRLYRSHLKNWILPAIGELQAQEVTVQTCEKLFNRVRDRTSYDSAKAVRAALSGVCNYAVKHGAMTASPVRSAGKIAGKKKKEVRAMTAEQRVELMVKLREFAYSRQIDSRGRSLGARGQIWLMLPEFVEAMLSTGIRLGELLALTGGDVNPAERTVRVDHHLVVDLDGVLLRESGRKGGEAGITLEVPGWSLPMWRRRKMATGSGPLFPNAKGEWLSQSTVGGRVREAFDACGFDWVTSHVFRKTVSTLLDGAGLPTTHIADQLGNTPRVVEEHYRARRVANEGSAAVLEGMWDQ